MISVLFIPVELEKLKLSFSLCTNSESWSFLLVSNPHRDIGFLFFSHNCTSCIWIFSQMFYNYFFTYLFPPPRFWTLRIKEPCLIYFCKVVELKRTIRDQQNLGREPIVQTQTTPPSICMPSSLSDPGNRSYIKFRGELTFPACIVTNLLYMA